MDWKVGDWCVFDMGVRQIKEIRDGGGMEVSDGMFCTSGMLMERLRPLTLRNKRLAEGFAFYYRSLDEIRGARGFNYPDISRLFNVWCLEAIDSPDEGKAAYDKVHAFIKAARDCQPIIDGIHLFRS